MVFNKINKCLLIALCTLAITSCKESFFEQFPSNNITEGNHFKTDDDFNQGVAACYARLKTQMSFHLTELAYRADECELLSMAVSTQNRYDLDHFAENSSNGILSDIWDAWYNGIYRCNDVLDHLSGADIKNHDKFRGECLFMRSWWYFTLYRTFGVVPIVETVVTPAAAKLVPRCTDDEMLSLLVNNLSEAADLLPEKKTAEVARVTSMSAQTLLAKVYLTFGKYAEAKSILEKAMANTNYGLMASTEAVFDVSNKMNKEIIFALYYNKTNDNGHGYWYSANTPVLEDITNPTKYFLNIYDTDDNRLRLVNSYVKITNTIYAMNKWYDVYDATYVTHVGNDFPHLRYADVILMYAEAMGQLGDIPTALNYLNQTRERAGLTELTTADISSKDQFINALALERGREFALEGQRWYDLVRLGLAVDFFRGKGYVLDSHNMIFPIPQGQIEIVNNSSILWQNPGF